MITDFFSIHPNWSDPASRVKAKATYFVFYPFWFVMRYVFLKLYKHSKSEWWAEMTWVEQQRKLKKL